MLGPLVLLAAMLYHPFMISFADDMAVGAMAKADTARWIGAHLLTALGFGLVGVAFVALREHLRDAGENGGSAWGLPFVVLGTAIFVMLPALELAPIAAIKGGGDPGLVQVAIDDWFTPALIGASLLFLIGVFGFIIDLRRSQILSPGATNIVTTALVLMAIARVPSSFALYMWGLSGVVAFLVIGRAMWASGGSTPASAREVVA